MRSAVKDFHVLTELMNIQPIFVRLRWVVVELISCGEHLVFVDWDLAYSIDGHRVVFDA
jgi:hypothetical protein